MTLTAAERRDAARFMRDIWRYEHKARRRRPHASETVISAYATAREILDAWVGNPFKFLGAPRVARGCLSDLTGGGSKVPAQLADAAEAILRYLDQAGDLATAKPESVAVDRRVIETLAADYFTPGISTSQQSPARSVYLTRAFATGA